MMFGISGSEFFIVLVIAIMVIPSNEWRGVARWFARIVRWVREFIGKIQDEIDELESEIVKDEPISKLSKKTMDDMMATFSTPIRSRKKTKSKKS